MILIIYMSYDKRESAQRNVKVRKEVIHEHGALLMLKAQVILSM